MNLLEDLNESQRLAVEYCDGPSLVIAGAGSGKTRVLTYKIAWLLEQGMKPWNILALTFTNKAAREMKERIGRLVGQERASRLYMGTFHSIFSHILRVEAEHLGYNGNFTIYDETDSRSLLKAVIKEMGLDEKVYKPATVHNRISMAKNHLIMAHEYGQRRELVERDINTKMPAISQIFLNYQNRCKQSNAMDFDDLLTLTYTLFNEHEDIRRKYAERFQFVLVDEYQDTNSVQQRIVLQLTKDHQHVCVVGDDAQSIYGFRGANIDNILDFQQMFQGTKLFKLEQNYRSTQRIVQAANSLIKKNERQIPKDVYSRNDEGERVILKEAYSDREEASIVCNEIKRLMRKENSDYNDFAILYRTNAQSRAFEDEMLKQGISYRVYGGLSFYQRKEIKDIIAYFRMVVNPNDEEAFKRIVNYPTRGIGATTVTKITACANANGVSLWTVVSNPALFSLDVNKGTLTKLDAFRSLIEGFIKRFEADDAYQLGHDIITESGISKDLYGDNSPEAVARQENLEEFLAGLQDFVESRKEEGRLDEITLRDYLQEVSLLTDLDSDGNEEERRKVTLMTVHSAKGLEFPTVFVVGLEENIFPSPLSTNSKRELEEERRLLYVAITRAEKHCYLTYAKSRWRYGHMEFSSPSRFLRDIDSSLIADESGAAEQTRRSSYGSGSRFENTLFGDGRRFQNSNPVASQFRADPKPREAVHREEPPRDPFSPSFKRTLAASGGNLRRISSVVNHTPASASRPSAAPSGLLEGQTIEHERFGIGTVVKLEGTGENQKATVQFRNSGTKQLLLKFARFKVIS
ncbi:MAG: UvrD-helicase domain-containing protein [Prevotella sp.]|nr:UvrD-helicase domain-containing protein [Prevotella sp.]